MTQQYKEQSKDTKNNLDNSYRHAERNQTKQNTFSMIPYDVQIQVKTYADRRKNNSFSWKEILTRKGT